MAEADREPVLSHRAIPKILTPRFKTLLPCSRLYCRQTVLYMLRLGSLGFGGPVALVSAMRRDLVEERRWISEACYKEGLALAQLAPGPLAAQLGIYMGYVHYRILGATLAGIAFVIPSFIMVVALGWAYVRFGGIPWMQAVFYGAGAAVVGIIAMSAKKLTEKSVGKDKLLWAIYVLMAVITVVTESEVAWVFIAAGVLMWLLRAPPKWLARTNLHKDCVATLRPDVFWHEEHESCNWNVEIFGDSNTEAEGMRRLHPGRCSGASGTVQLG